MAWSEAGAGLLWTTWSRAIGCPACSTSGEADVFQPSRAIGDVGSGKADPPPIWHQLMGVPFQGEWFIESAANGAAHHDNPTGWADDLVRNNLMMIECLPCLRIFLRNAFSAP